MSYLHGDDFPDNVSDVQKKLVEALRYASQYDELLTYPVLQSSIVPHIQTPPPGFVYYTSTGFPLAPTGKGWFIDSFFEPNACGVQRFIPDTPDLSTATYSTCDPLNSRNVKHHELIKQMVHDLVTPPKAEYVQVSHMSIYDPMPSHQRGYAFHDDIYAGWVKSMGPIPQVQQRKRFRWK